MDTLKPVPTSEIVRYAVLGRLVVSPGSELFDRTTFLRKKSILKIDVSHSKCLMWFCGTVV